MVTYSDGTPLACFIPGHMSPGIYMVEDIPPTAKDHAWTSKITYDIFHKHFGHPSKEVIQHAKKHITNMPEIEIPSEDSTCPGCAKGKLSNWAFPPIEWCAICAFELIHSDLKSFPIESYHRHQYIIIFFDGFSSMAWVCCICDKNDSLTATCYFLKMVTTQYNSKIQGWMSDAGGEYKSKAFNDMLKEQGIW